MGWEPGRKGAGSVQEAVKEKAGSGIPKVVGTSRNRKTFCNNAFHNRKLKHKEVGTTEEGVGNGRKMYGKREVRTSLFPLPQCKSQVLESDRKAIVDKVINNYWMRFL